jgi:mycobactin polyketide synthetase MbtD
VGGGHHRRRRGRADRTAAIEASLRDHPADPLILTGDRDRLQTFVHSRRADETPTETAGIDVAAQVRTELAAALNLGDAATIDLAASLLDLGVDSLLALDLRKRLRRATGKSVSLAALLGGITGDELIATLTPDSAATRATSQEGGNLA